MSQTQWKRHLLEQQVECINSVEEISKQRKAYVVNLSSAIIGNVFSIHINVEIDRIIVAFNLLSLFTSRSGARTKRIVLR